MVSAALRQAAPGRRFRFAGVVVDASAARLFVDGRERICSQRAMRLLLILCESPGVVLARQDVMDRLWPGGQIVSDEALTQAVFRTRACLDRYADRIVTIRGVGLRLDAEVEHDVEPASREDDEAGEAGPPLAQFPASAASPTPAAVALAASTPASTSIPTPTEPPRRRASDLAPPPSPARAHARRLGAALLLAVALTIAAWWSQRTGDAPAIIDAGYGLLAADAHVSRDDSLPLLEDAFAYEAGGDRARARALLETVHQSDPRTPLPAIFLALWAVGGSDGVEAERWLQQSQQRLEALRDPMAAALHLYTRSELSANGQDVLRHAGAVLDLRPGAWQMRVARAHVLLSEGLREAALRELTAIDFGDLPHRKLAMALADRASLGDVAGAERELARIAQRHPDDETLAFLRGRIAWSRGDYAAAREAFALAAERARGSARFDLVNRATANLGIIAVIQGDLDAAIDWSERARVGMVETRWRRDEIDLSLVLAQLHALRGESDLAATELARAESVAARSSSPELRDLSRAVRERLLPVADDADLPDDADAALAPLLEAHLAMRRGDRDAARGALATAARRLDPDSPLHDEVRLLSQALGLPVAPETRIDPPYPPLSRFATRLVLARQAGSDSPTPPGASSASP